MVLSFIAVVVYFFLLAFQEKEGLSIISFLLLIIIIRIIVVYVRDPEWDNQIKSIVALRLDALTTGVLAGFVHIYFKDHWNRYAKSFLFTGIILLVAASVYFCLKRM